MTSDIPILEIFNLHVSCEEKEILHGINLRIMPGEVHVLLGQNGSGKSTLLNVLMGLSGYTVTDGYIHFMGQDITNMPISDRAQLGMGIMFQKAPTVPGLKLKTLLNSAFHNNMTEEAMNQMSELTNMEEFLSRDVNVGFSGGEMKRCELLQLALQDPDFIMLDEPESGVDLENMKLVGERVRNIMKCKSDGTKRAALVITHIGHILEYLTVTRSHIMLNGNIVCCGFGANCLEVIQKHGYEECIKRLGTEEDCVNNEMNKQTTTTTVSATKTSKSTISCGCGKGDECCQVNGGKSYCATCPLKTQSTPTVFNNQNKKVKLNLMDDFEADALATVETKPSSICCKAIPSVPVVHKAIEDIDQEIAAIKVNADDPSLFDGHYEQYNNEKVTTEPCSEEGIEVLSLSQAIAKYPDFKDKYLWKVMNKDKDYVTKGVYEHEKEVYNGYVIIAHEGACSKKPVKAQLLLESIPTQFVHNILVAKKNSNLSISSFCSGCNIKQTPADYDGEHFGISEFFVEENAHMSFSMIHNYCMNYRIYPRSASRIEKNGVFISSYVCLDPVKKVQTCPCAYLVGENAISRFSSILMGHKDGVLDVGSTAFLQAPGTSSEAITRALTKGGTIIASGKIVSENIKTTGHIECQGMVLNDGIIRSIPEIEGGYDCELSHEAAVGKIAQDKVDYLMSRGINEDDAIAIIIRGFLDVKIKGIPQVLQDEIEYVMEEAAKGF